MGGRIDTSYSERWQRVFLSKAIWSKEGGFKRFKKMPGIVVPNT